jgi:mannose-6-phosphate isomerase-like protein (cupin superfamily)
VKDLPLDRGTIQPIPYPDSHSGMDMHVISLNADSKDGPFHYHSTSENFYYVLSGTVRLRLKDGPLLLSAGDSAWLPAGLPHGVSVDGAEPVKLLEVYWPAPADYVMVEEV